MMKRSGRTFKQLSAAFLTLCMLTAVVPVGAEGEVEYTTTPRPGTGVPEGTVDITPAADKFTIDGRGFVLLDTFDNAESAYYVTTTDAYGDMETISGDDISQVSNPTGKQINYDAYKSNAFLNGDFLTKGNNFTSLGNDTTTYYKLPQGIIDNINKNHVWKRFVNDAQYGAGAPREYTTGVSLLSWTDFTTYVGKIGVRDVFNDSNVASTAGKYYYLRDSHAWGGNGAVMMFGDNDTNSNVAVYGNQWGMKYGLLRPAFYLKKNFFKNTSVDLSTVGENVKTAIRNVCTDGDLLRLYSAEECKTYFNIESSIKVTTAVRSGAELTNVKLLDTLTASVSGGEATEYKWQMQTGEGDWTDIEGATSNEYIVSAAQAGAKVNCAAKVNDGWFYSEAVQIPNYEVNATGDGIAVPEGTVTATASADKFTVDGKEFILLDTFDNDASAYYVTTTDAYGDMKLKTDGELSVLTDKEINYDAYNAIAFLNGDFLTKGNNFTSPGNDTTTYHKLPQGIIDNINQNHVWWRFVNDYRKQEGVKSTYQAGISFLSWTDFTTYAGKLGAVDGFLDSNVANADVYFLRDTNSWGGNSALALFCTADKQCKHWGQYVRQYGLLRPAFYLKKNFFKNTSVDLSTVGENVKTAIRNVCTDGDLLRLYSAEECKTYFNIESSIKVTTAVRSGAEFTNVKLLDTLTASVSGGEATEYKWQTRTGEGDWTDIEGATSNEYIVSAAQAGAKVSCAAKVNDGWFYSEAVQIPNYEVNATGDGIAVPEGTVTATASADKFTVDGKEFILLDTFDNDASTYYVTTMDAYGDMKLKTDGEWWILEGKEINYDSYNALAFLNGDFLTKGNNFTALGNDTTTYYKLPQKIIDNINQNHVWWRFVNDYRKQNGVKSTYQAGISFLSWTDFTKYAGKLGAVDGFSNSNVANADVYFLRDTNNWGDDTSLALFSTTDKQCKHWGQYTKPYGFVRPAFYLEKDFFKNTKLDLNATGENVLAAMRSNYCIEDLIHLYSMQELYEKGFSPRNYAMKASLTYTGTDGGTLSSLNGAANVKAAVTIESGKPEAKDAVLILKAVDSKNGLYISTKPVTVKANGETHEEISLEELKNMTDECRVNVFLWEDFNTLRPITQSLTYGQSSSVE